MGGEVAEHVVGTIKEGLRDNAEEFVLYHVGYGWLVGCFYRTITDTDKK